MNFVSDGLATTLVVDCSLTPIEEEFAGSVPTAVLSPVATSAFTGPIAGVTASITGTTVTFTFPSAPPKLDGSSNLILYTLTFLLQYQT